MSPYVKHVEYHFSAIDELFAVVVRSSECLVVRELSPSRPQAAHRQGFINKVGDAWEWDTFGNSELVFIRYGSQAQADAIVEHINKHPVPGT